MGTAIEKITCCFRLPKEDASYNTNTKIYSSEIAGVEPYSKCPSSNHQSQQRIQILGYHIFVDAVIRDKIFNTQNKEFFNWKTKNYREKEKKTNPKHFRVAEGGVLYGFTGVILYEPIKSIILNEIYLYKVSKHIAPIRINWETFYKIGNIFRTLGFRICTRGKTILTCKDCNIYYYLNNDMLWLSNIVLPLSGPVNRCIQQGFPNPYICLH